MRDHTERLAADPTVRSVVSKTMQEWLDAPRLFIQVKFRDEFEAVRGELPTHEVIEAEGNKGSFTVTFPTWRERDEAHEVLNRAGVRFRSGKALVPFRISGNVEWGVPLPEVEGCRDLTAWVWPRACGRPSASPAPCSPATPQNSRPRAWTPPTSPNAPSPTPSSWARHRP